MTTPRIPVRVARHPLYLIDGRPLPGLTPQLVNWVRGLTPLDAAAMRIYDQMNAARPRFTPEQIAEHNAWHDQLLEADNRRRAHQDAIDHLSEISLCHDSPAVRAAADAILEKPLPIGSLKLADNRHQPADCLVDDLGVVELPAANHAVDVLDQMAGRVGKPISRDIGVELLDGHDASPVRVADAPSVGERPGVSGPISGTPGATGGVAL